MTYVPCPRAGLLSPAPRRAFGARLGDVRRCSAILLVHVKRDAEIGCACFIRSLRALISSTNPFAGCLQGCRADISTCFDWIRIYGKGLRESNPAIWPFFVPSGNADLDEMLAKCQGGENKREIRECEKVIKDEYKLKTYQNSGEKFQLGNVAYYYVADFKEETRKGVKEYNNIAYTATGQPLLNLQMMVQNTGSSNETLMCTSPSICNYTVWDGGKKWVNSGSDFTSGNVVLKPGQAKFVNILWGPAIGYGSYENFEYDSGKDYYLRIAEPFGNLDLPLNLIVVP